MTDVSILVQADADDAEEDHDGTDFSASTTSLGPMAGNTSARVFAGMRFAHADLPPQGATIDGAELYVVAASTNADNFGPNHTLQAHDVDASPNFTDEADVTSRTLTTASQTLNTSTISGMSTSVHSLLGNVADNAKDEVAEVVARAGWDEAAITILVRHPGGGSSTSDGLGIRTHENSTTLCARLDISYTVAAAAAGPLVGGKLVGHGILRGRLVA